MATIVVHAQHALNAVKLTTERLAQPKPQVIENVARSREILAGVEKAAVAALNLMGSQALVSLTTIELSVIHEGLLAQRK